MRQENSVLFALRDLRAMESDRVLEEARAAAVEEERRRAEAEQRRADEAERRAAQQRADDSAARMTQALRESAHRNERLESDVQALRALVSAAQPPPARARPHALMLLVAASVLVLAAALWTRRPPLVQERVVYAPAPAAPAAAAPAPGPVPVAPSLAAAPPVRSAGPQRTERVRVKRPTPAVRKPAPPVPTIVPAILPPILDD
jgi:hypothetical protein